MSAIDILRSFAEARTDDEELLPVRAFTYGTLREGLKRIAELERQLARRTQKLNDELGNHRPHKGNIADGMPCACRFDENDDNTHECLMHKERREQLAAAEKEAAISSKNHANTTVELIDCKAKLAAVEKALTAVCLLISESTLISNPYHEDKLSEIKFLPQFQAIDEFLSIKAKEGE